MWQSRSWQPRQGLAEETRIEDEVAWGWRYRQPFSLEAMVDEPVTGELLFRPIIP
jgi:hypothetical protein